MLFQHQLYEYVTDLFKKKKKKNNCAWTQKCWHMSAVAVSPEWDGGHQRWLQLSSWRRSTVRTLFACRTPETADRSWHPKQSAALVVAEAKTWVWEKFPAWSLC